YPFEGDAVQKMIGHQSRQPTPVCEYNPSVPEGLAGIVEQLMQKAPQDRFASPAEIMEALKPLALDPVRFPQLLAKGPAAVPEKRVPTRQTLSDLKKSAAPPPGPTPPLSPPSQGEAGGVPHVAKAGKKPVAVAPVRKRLP